MQLCITLLQGQVSGCNCSFCSACRTLVHRIRAATADVHVCCRHNSTEHNQQGVIYTCGSLESSIPLHSASSVAPFFASAASRYFLSVSSAVPFSASCGPRSRVQEEVRMQLPMCMCVVGTIPQNTISKE